MFGPLSLMQHLRWNRFSQVPNGNDADSGCGRNDDLDLPVSSALFGQEPLDSEKRSLASQPGSSIERSKSGL